MLSAAQQKNSWGQISYNHNTQEHGDFLAAESFDDVYRGQSRRDLLRTDRGMFTDSAEVVWRDRPQLEIGYAFDNFRNNGPRTHQSTFESALRVGLDQYGMSEFRVRWDYNWIDQQPGGKFDGAEDIELGFKLSLTDQNHWLPRTAIVLDATLPTGASRFNSDDVQWGAEFLYEWRTAEGIFLVGSTGMHTDEIAGDSFVDIHQSVALGLDLGRNLSVYSEYFGIYRTQAADNFPQNNLQFGALYRTSDFSQFDFSVGFGLNEEASDFFAGVGWSGRF